MSINTQTTKSGLVYQVDSLLKRSYSDLSMEDLHTLMLMIQILKTLAENRSGKTSYESSTINTMGLGNGIQTLLTRLSVTDDSSCPRVESITTNQKYPTGKSNGHGLRSSTIQSKGLGLTSWQLQESRCPTDLKEMKE